MSGSWYGDVEAKSMGVRLGCAAPGGPFRLLHIRLMFTFVARLSCVLWVWVEQALLPGFCRRCTDPGMWTIDFREASCGPLEVGIRSSAVECRFDDEGGVASNGPPTRRTDIYVSRVYAGRGHETLRFSERGSSTQDLDQEMESNAPCFGKRFKYLGDRLGRETAPTAVVQAVAKVSPERIGSEVVQMVRSAVPVRALELVEQVGLLPLAFTSTDKVIRGGVLLPAEADPARRYEAA